MELTERQRDIVQAALTLTAEGGIQNLTIRNLADKLGFTEPAIYRHFKNKSEIVVTMIKSFEQHGTDKLELVHKKGILGIESFVKSRFKLVVQNPPLAKVLFSEELFMDEPEYSVLLLEMMHTHKSYLVEMLAQAQKNGDVRQDVDTDMVFRIIMGPVRLLVKQWSTTEGAFDLMEKGDLLWETLRRILK